MGVSGGTERSFKVLIPENALPPTEVPPPEVPPVPEPLPAVPAVCAPPSAAPDPPVVVAVTPEPLEGQMTPASSLLKEARERFSL